MRRTKLYLVAVIGSILLTLGCGGGDNSQAAQSPNSIPIPTIQWIDAELTFSGDPQVKWMLPPNTISSLNLYRSSSIVGLSKFSLLATLPRTAVEYTDTTTQEGNSYAYRITCTLNGSEGSPVMFSSIAVHLLGPIDLTETTSAAGIGLHWTNRSTTVTKLTLQRSNRLVYDGTYWIPDQTQPLDLKKQDYFDGTPTPGCWAYYLFAEDDSGHMATATVTGFGPTSGTPSFKGSPQYLPVDNFFDLLSGQLNPTGSWELVARHSNDQYVGFKESASGWISNPITSSAYKLVMPGLAFNSAGFPHYVVLVGPALSGSVRDIVHIWQDQTGWNTETIASRKIYSVSTPGVWFAMDASGLMTLAWQLDDGFRGQNLEFATNESGEWKVTPITFGLIHPAGMYSVNLGTIQMAMTPDGTSHLGILCTASDVGSVLLLEHRKKNGGWSEEFAPVGSIQSNTNDPLKMNPLGNTGLAIAYERYDVANGGWYSIMLLRSDIAGWANPVTIAPAVSQSPVQPFLLSTTADGTQTALATSIPVGSSSNFVVYRFSNNMTEQALLADHGIPDGGTSMVMAFDQMNHLHLFSLDKQLTLSPSISIVYRFDEGN